MKKDNIGCLLQFIAWLLINGIGIYFVRTSPVFAKWFEIIYGCGFFLCCIVSLPLSAIKGKIGEFFQDLACTSRFYFLAFMPICIFGFLEFK